MNNSNQKKINYFDDIFSKYKLIKIDDFYNLLNNEPIDELSEQEKKRFNWFISNLKLKNQNEQIKILFRGTPISHLRKKSDDLKLLFQIGEKSYHAVVKDKELKVEKKPYASINDTDTTVFDFIFNTLNSIFNDKDKKKKIIIERFKERDNGNCYAYFSDDKNKEKFLKTTGNLTDKEKIKIRDIYLYLIHTFGKKGFLNYSFFISTSFNPNTALRLSRAKSNFKKDELNVVFHYFLPAPISRFGLSMEDIKNYNKYLKSLKLPYATIDFYYQAEFSVKGGLFPHYLLGFNVNVKNINYFVLNPYILEIPFKNNDQIEKVLKNGLPIDQRNIKSQIKNESNYEKIIYLLNDKIFDEENIK